MNSSIRLLIKKNLLRVNILKQAIVDFLEYTFLPVKTYEVGSTEGKKVIAFLGADLLARIPRMAKVIQEQGDFECILIVKEGKDYKKFNTEYFGKIITFRSGWHLRKVLKGLKGAYLIHAYALPTFHIELAIKHSDVPVIMDVQDMYVSYFGLKSPKLYMRVEMPHEAYGIEHASGIVTHSIELGNATKVYGIKKRPPTLFFPLYCNEEVFRFRELSLEPEDIHIVYIGVIAGSFQDDENFGSMKFFPLIEKLSQQKIHFHIYPAPSLRFKDLILDEYQQVADSNPYFHLHNSISQDQLSEELSQYHFGIIPFYLEDTGRSENKLGRGTSLKMYNYLEAGIPVIISEDLAFQCWMATRYGAGIKIKKPDLAKLRELIESLDYQGVKENLRKNRERISLGENIPRLLRFYEEIGEKHKSMQK